jgi:hypothetical protein
MMNPLSVRLFLDADALRFDVVLFDDASQISTEDASGRSCAASRSSSPATPSRSRPSRCCARPTGPFESILDAASTVADKESAHFSEYPLRWHYRSMNESLIAFSRRHFYPELVSFPAARVDSAISSRAPPPTRRPPRRASWTACWSTPGRTRTTRSG